jgi:acyl-coenzyme A synthetase/AMP-(fatty) acid ligase
VICHHALRGPITVARFLAEAAALAGRLPDGPGHAVDLCEDRYLSLLGFAAALLRGHPVLLGGGRGAAARFLPVAAGFAGAYVLADAQIPASPLPVLRADQLGEAPFLPLPLALRAIPPGQLAAIAFTSGSTGAPAAHAKPWGALLHGAAAAAERFDLLDAPASLVATVPPQHMYGFETTIMLPLRAPVAIHSGAAFFPSDVLGALEAVPPRRVLVTTPLHLRALLGAPLGAGRPAPLAAVISATAPLGRDLAEAVERGWATPVLEIYGATEAGSMASRRTLEDEAWLPYRGVVLQAGAATVPGIGEVALSDVLEPLGDGRARLLGRAADLVKLGGKRVSLAELNRALLAVEGVQDGAFLAPEDLEANPAARLAAYVVAPGRDAAAILEGLRARLDPAFLPRRVVLLDALPRDALGKLPRRALAALEA